MKKIALFTLFSIILVNFAQSEEVCKKCQLVREYNDKNPSKYEFYDDYLKDKEAGIAEEIRYDDTKVDEKK